MSKMNSTTKTKAKTAWPTAAVAKAKGMHIMYHNMKPKKCYKCKSIFVATHKTSIKYLYACSCGRSIWSW